MLSSQSRKALVVCLTPIILFVFFFFFSCSNNKPPPQKRSITILWAKWGPADMLQKLADDFTLETGIHVKLVQESWGTWQKLFFDEMSRRGQRFDMVIGDSQWLGRGATEGHYVELTKWMQKHRVDQSMTAASITGYSEFPKGSGHLWAVPVEGDAMGFSYRKDLFEDPVQKKIFKEKFGYELDVPKTWYELKDIAQFFHRPEQNFYGVLAWVEPHYDGLTMGVDSLIWAWGADLGNHKDYRVRGILNSDKGVAALEFYKQLNQYSNPLWHEHYLDTDKNSNAPMMSGQVAMAMGYFAINTELLDPARNPYFDRIGFFSNPKGPEAEVCSLGGQGISIVSYTKKKDLCFQFLEWFIQDTVQEKWADLGGLTCNKKVLASDRFLNASPINRPFKESIEMAKDFWAVPEYTRLLKVSQKNWYECVVKKTMSSQEAMDAVAREWELIFEEAGYYKE